jgi:hypothetical protein
VRWLNACAKLPSCRRRPTSYSCFDVKWVMSQVRHADSKMTLDVYAQLEQRDKREHGVRFDALVREARARLNGADISP